MRFLLIIFISLPELLSGADSLPSLKDKVPQTVEDLWKDYDPSAEPLNTQLVREQEEYGQVIRYLRYYIGTFKGKPVWMAAFYAFPKNAKTFPGVLNMHGGCQRANLSFVKFHASQGYGALSVNWGGKPMEGAKPNEANTDWRSVDPTRNNVPGYFNMLPRDHFGDPME